MYQIEDFKNKFSFILRSEQYEDLDVVSFDCLLNTNFSKSVYPPYYPGWFYVYGPKSPIHCPILTYVTDEKLLQLDGLIFERTPTINELIDFITRLVTNLDEPLSEIKIDLYYKQACQLVIGNKVFIEYKGKNVFNCFWKDDSTIPDVLYPLAKDLVLKLMSKKGLSKNLESLEKIWTMLGYSFCASSIQNRSKTLISEIRHIIYALEGIITKLKNI